MLLVLNIVYDKHIPVQVARDLHRSKTWTSDGLKRYREEKYRRIKKQNQEWQTTRHITRRDSIRDKKRVNIQQTGMDYQTGRRSDSKKEWWNKISLYSHLQTHAQVGDSNRKYQEKYM